MKNMNYPRAGELHRRASREAALQNWPVGCTLGGPVGCTLNWAAGKSGREGCPFLQPAPPFFAVRRTAFLCSPPARPSVLSSVQPADSSRFSFGNMALQPARPTGPPISVIHLVVLVFLHATFLP